MIGPRGRPTTYTSAYRVLEPFASEVDRLITGSLADDTVKSYSLAVQIFYYFRMRFNLSTTWPPTVDGMINFIAYLSSHGYQYLTAKTYLAGVSFYITAHNWFDPTTSS